MAPRRATSAAPKVRGIEATLDRLGIDKSATAAEAAQDAAEEASQEAGDEDEGEGVDSEGGEGEGEGEGDEDTPLSPKDEMRLSQQERGVPMADDLDDEGGGDDMPLPPAERPPRLDPATVPNPATARTGRGRPRERPQGIKLSKSLAEKVPGSDKIKVYKRINGRRWFIEDYTRSDLQQFPDFESFLTRYVKPVHGAGEYDLVGVDGRNNESELGQIRLLADPTKNTPESSAMHLVDRMITEQRERDEKWMKEKMSGHQDPLALLAGVMNLKKQLEGETAVVMPDMFKMLMESGKESGNTTMMMMMAMMQQQSQMMTALLTKPKEEDPIMKALLAKLLSDGGGLGGGGMAMPPPPPPPPALDVPSLLTAVAGLMQTISGGGGEDEFKEYLKQKELARKDENLGIKDILDLVLKAKDGGGQSGGFKDTIDNLAAVMNIAQNISRQNEPGASAGFFDALAALFSNRDFAGSISQAIRLKADAKAGAVDTRLQAEVQRLQMERRLFEREKQQFLAAGGQLPPPQQTVQNTAPAPQNTAPAPQNTAPAQQARGFRPAVTQADVQAAQQKVQGSGKLPDLPAQTYEHLNNILQAKDDADRVGKTVQMLVYFTGFDAWKPFSEGLLVFVRNGNRQKAMEFMQALFEGLAYVNMFPAENVMPLMELLNENFVTVQEQLIDFTAESEQQAPLTGEELTQPPENNVEAPAAAG